MCHMQWESLPVLLLDQLNKDRSQVLCFECKRYSIAGKDNQMTKQEMREYLKEHAINVPVAAT
jgi:hypothetical protein